MKSIAILGCGNIGLAVAEGLLGSKSSDLKLIATRRNLNQIQSLQDKGAEITSDNSYAVKNSKYVLIAVKPYGVESLLESVKDSISSEHVLISLASEVSIAQIRKVVGEKPAVFRAMPNTASSISESMTCIATDRHDNNLNEEVATLFRPIGETVIIDEQLMAAATILGACGIAYVLRFIRAMIQGGIQIGFDSKTASLIATQTVKGAAELLLQKKSHPEQEIDKVTTPKGCTITGLNEMEHQGFSSSLIRGIVKSFEKIED